MAPSYVGALLGTYSKEQGRQANICRREACPRPTVAVMHRTGMRVKYVESRADACVDAVAHRSPGYSIY